VLWKYFETTADGERIAHLIWATGRVARVADGLTDKRSSRAKKILPAGALLWDLGMGCRSSVQRESRGAVVDPAA
jgi:hypothetical protein